MTWASFMLLSCLVTSGHQCHQCPFDLRDGEALLLTLEVLGHRRRTAEATTTGGRTAPGLEELRRLLSHETLFLQGGFPAIPLPSVQGPLLWGPTRQQV